ncbi:hypothetical protein FS749_015335 [Ceratobasidium sp. UAMH 11750]|nr:hypothetical protein FS749_015335 [Ceratobasidium sp. UAMH 11750]
MEFDSHFLAPASSKQPRKSPSRQALGANGRSGTIGASLAHELAAAVMYEPSDSRALADELGLEFDDEEEGEGETLEGHRLDTELGGEALGGIMGMSNHSEIETPSRPSRNNMLNGHAPAHPHDLDSDFESSPSKPPPPLSFTLSTPSADPIDTLKENVKFLDRFITHLQHMDIDPSSPTRSSYAPATTQMRRMSMHGGAEPAVERIATDMIRHIDDARREREDQLRDLINYEREFRKIDGEAGGADRLGSLEPLEDVSLTDGPTAGEASYSTRALDAVPEDEYDDSWEAQRDPRDVFDDDMHDQEDGDDPAFADRSIRHTTAQTILPPPPPYPSGPLTPSSTLPHLAHMRAVSQILATSLSGLSEHVQVNGAAAAEAGRKLRALKNKVGDLQAEWTSAEQSMVRIERSERGLEWEKTEGTETPQGKRVDGRVIVKEIKASFFAQLQQAEMKVQAMFPTAA